ncbi:MAG: hypothetical protein DWP95_10835 [Proteobacteria bacterium]|nr:MAG: hypothetical protein DWP95_10835 [Pseudomonadota bacterium]
MKLNNDLKLWLNHNPQQDNKKAKIYSDGILHQLLSDACPESAPFKIKRNQNGKPYTEAAIYFSYSHSRRAYLYGLSKHGAIGLDIENTNKPRDFMALSQRYFHVDERQQMQDLQPQDRRLFFYRLWTRKEAWCKLSGGVLWYYLGRSVLADQVQTENQHTVYLNDLTDIKGFAAAMATHFIADRCPINVIK